MDNDSSGGWSPYRWTVVLLLTAFALTLIIRVIFSVSVFEEFGWLYIYGGGSDSFYHWRVTEYILVNHTNLILDPLLKYPHGAINPREPLFDWMNAILGIVFAPIFGGNATTAAAFFLNIDSPLWSGFTVFLIYLIGKEVSSRRMGLIAALTWPFLVGSIQSGALGYANYLTFYTFFILLYFYSYLRVVKSASTRNWITNFGSLRSVVDGLRQFAREDRTTLKWAVFCGVSLGALALAWQGYPLGVAIVVIFLATIMVVERIRRVDSTGLYIATLITGLIGFPMAMPYYVVQGLFKTWFDLPLLLFFGGAALLLVFLLLRRYPWVVSVPALVGLVLVGLAGLAVVNPTDFQNLVTGQGYFAKTLIYSTVAEAQAPSFDSLVIAYGVLTFFLAFVGLGLFAVHLARRRFRREHTLFVVFAIVSIFLPISASKFFYVGSPAFTLLPAEAIVLILDVAGYERLRHQAASLADTRGQFTAIRRSFKARHVIVILLVVVLLVPNIWYSVDAGIPYNTKSTYSTQIYDTLPAALRVPSANASSYYLGASGTDLDTPNQYDEAGYDWLATQDANLPYADRPAFISWWDYGFQAVAEGQHPSVADNFQNGIPAGGNFLLAQNESLAIAVLTVTLLEVAQERSTPYLSPGLNAVLARDGVDLSVFHNLLANTTEDIALVVAHPERYLPVDPTTLTAVNAMFDATSWYLANTMSENAVAKLYDDVQAYTGWSIRYAMVDSRLYPFSGTDTGIFYAPAELTGRIIGADGAPTTYFTIEAEGSDGNIYPIGDVPSDVTVVNYVLNQEAPFYNSMLYRIYMGYNGTDVGLGPGIPGLEGSLTGDNPMPGWMLQHFEVVYRTAYYCPDANESDDPTCPIATNLAGAEALAAKTNGTADTSSSSYFSGGEAILTYYAGQTMSGTISLPSGAPVAGARVTVSDGWGIPHQTVVTGANGAFSIVLPPGNDTINVTTGPLQGLTQQGEYVLDSIPYTVPAAVGYSFDAPTVVQNIVLSPGVVNGFVYWNATGNTSYDPSVDSVVSGGSVTLGGPSVANYTATTDAGGSFQLRNVAPGTYNLTVTTAGVRYAEGNVTVTPGKAANATVGLVPSRISGTVSNVTTEAAPLARVTVSSAAGVVATTTANASGGYSFANLVPGNYSVQAYGSGNYASMASAVELNASSPSATLNLTIGPMATVTVAVSAGGAPVSGFPIRLTPILGSPATVGRNASFPAPSSSLVYATNALGLVTAQVPVGNYSVYGYGPVGATFLTGFTSAYVHGASAATSVALSLVAGLTLQGRSPLPVGVAPTALSAIQVTLYNSSGVPLVLFANSSGVWSATVPAGTYTVQALAISNTTGVPNYTALARVVLSYSTSVSLPLTTAFTAAPQVGAILPDVSALYPASGAAVSVTVGPGDATVSTYANAHGVATFFLPVASGGTSYCLATQATGFAPYQACGLSASDLTSLTRVVTGLNNVSVTVTATGLPSGATLQINATAGASPATSRIFSGGGSQTLSLIPGTYTFSTWVKGTGSTVYRPPATPTLNLSLGAAPQSLSIAFYAQVQTTGTFSLPSGVSATAVTVHLYAPPYNVTLNGSAYVNGFYIPAGTYSLYANASVGGVAYSNLTRVTVSSSGTASPRVPLAAGALVTGALTLPNGTALNLGVPITWSGPSGTTVYAPAVGGTFSLAVPTGATVVPSFNVTTSVTVGGALLYATYTPAAGASCTGGPGTTTCTVPVAVAYRSTTLGGAFYYGGARVTLNGTVRLVGPYPSPQLTTVTTANGSFSVTLRPGSYSLYVTAGSGAGVIAAVANVTVGYSTPSLPVLLSPSWALTVTVNSGGTGASSATVTFSGSGGSFPVAGVSTGVPTTFALPRGTWTVRANATVAPYGLPTNASAASTVSLAAGNAATSLPLKLVFAPKVAIATVSPTSVTIGPGGGTARFSFTVTNTGNVPVTVEFYGDPTSWNFTFSPATVTLGVGAGNNSTGAVVTIVVPAGAATDHAPVVLGATLVSNSTQVVGTSSPSPVVSILPSPGIAVGAVPTSPPAVAPETAELSFQVTNTGNTPYSASLAVANAATLAQLGWNATIYEGSTLVTGPVNFSAGATTDFSVYLTGTAHAIPPGAVVVQATTTVGSRILTATGTFSVPVAKVTSTAPGGVTGPLVGPPPAVPSWFWLVVAVLPAALFLAVAFTLRWWRTRRWTRR